MGSPEASGGPVSVFVYPGKISLRGHAATYGNTSIFTLPGRDWPMLNFASTGLGSRNKEV